MTVRRWLGLLGALLAVFTMTLVSPPTSSTASAAPKAAGGSVLVISTGGDHAGRPVSRPPNGTILYAGITGGAGRLRIKNGLRQDAVVALVRGGSKAVSIYVRSQRNATVRNIKDGTYRIYWTTGSRFNRSTGRFTSGATYRRFKDLVPFRTRSSGQYTVWTVTLHAVRGGNAPTTPIDPGDFPA